MGHIRLPNLRRTLAWREVVTAIESGASAEIVAARSAIAARAAFEEARHDPGFLLAVRLLAELPLAARTPAYLTELRRLGLNVAREPTLFEFSATLSALPDEQGRRTALTSSERSDLGALAIRALVGSFNALIGPELPSLFEADEIDFQSALGRYARGQAFGRLAREFFARFVQGTLDYYLSRELGNHLGPDQRFANSEHRAAFDTAIRLHCFEASRIVEEYAGGWLGKHVYQEGELTARHIAELGAFSLKKIMAELKRREDG